MASVMCVHCSQLVDHRHAPRITIEHSHAKIVVSALERQVAQDDTYSKVVNHQCNLT